jgi:multidrug efflux pump subunit AcrA (membrane-fusion protein)
MNKKMLSTVLGALVLAGISVWAVGRVKAKTALVDKGPVKGSIVALGIVKAEGGIADVHAQLQGRVLAVAVREGDRVTKGQLLAEIDSTEIQAVLSRLEAEQRAQGASASAVARGARHEERSAADAELRAAEAALALAEDRARRTERLRASGVEGEQAAFESQRQLDMARATVEQARAGRALAFSGGRAEDVSAARDRARAAQAAVTEAREKLQHSRVVAPISGVVLVRRIDEGDVVTAALGSEALFEIADPDHTEVALEIEEPDAMSVGEGQPVTLTEPGGLRPVAHGRVVRLSPRLGRRTIGLGEGRVRADTQVRTVWVRTDETSALLIGRRVEGRVELPEKEVAARVPRSAVRVKEGRAVVELDHGFFGTTQSVTLGIADEAFVEIRGVTPGTKLLLAHDERP